MVEKVLIEQLGNVLYCDYISKVVLTSVQSSYDNNGRSATIECLLDDPLTPTGMQMLALHDSEKYEYYIVRRKRG